MCKYSREIKQACTFLQESYLPRDIAMAILIGIPFAGIAVTGILFNVAVTQCVNWCDGKNQKIIKLTPL